MKLPDKPSLRSLSYFFVVALVFVPTEGFDWIGDANVNVRDGILLGGHYVAEDNGTLMSAFLGVPYAKPPVGQLRFKAPEKPTPWTERLRVRSFAPSCVQDKSFLAFVLIDLYNVSNQNPNASEDCLKINIFVPRNVSQSGLAALPVMVYIHGGALQSGTGNLVGFRLAYLSNAIVVSVNYRLNVFGFLSTEDATASGNFGFLDQQLALKWVKDNIASFGGNPDSITIFGLSAGAWSVAHHTISQGSRGLFNRIICQSGAIIDDHILQRNARKKVEALGAQLNCSQSQVTDIVDCLRQVPAGVLYTAANSPKVAPALDWFMPVVDGSFLKEKPEESLRKGDIAPVDVLSGVTRFEGYVYPLQDGGIFLMKSNPVLPKAKVLDILNKGYVLSMWNQTDAQRAALMSVYTPFGKENSSLEWTKALINATGDHLFVAPTSNFLYHMRQVSNNTFMYLFDQRPSIRLLQVSERPDYVGSTHADDYLFVNGDAFVKKLGSPKEQALSLRLAQLLGQFARDGKPNMTDMGIDWEPWQRNNRAYLILHSEASHMKMAKDLTPKRTAFWNCLLPAIKTTKEIPCNKTKISDPVVQTTSGAVRGRKRTRIGYEREEFLGVPYAAPPMAQLRFRPPEPPVNWTGTLETATFQPMCPQGPYGTGWSPRLDEVLGRGRNQSEDCLYINVVVPRSVEYARNRSLPVMVFIYGGGFVAGNGHELDGVVLAPYSNVIVVSLAYRVGVLGFFTTGDTAAPGNYGLMDQQAALRWVHNNIANFGGDPTFVTIFGESAGGAGVVYQMLNEESRRYFKRAIPMSGSATCPWAFDKVGKTAGVCRALADRVGCVAQNSFDMAKCMRDKPYEDIAKEIDFAAASLDFQPVLDGVLVKDDPKRLLESGVANKIEMMVGVNSLEGVVFAEGTLPTLLVPPQNTSINRTLFDATWPAILAQAGVPVENDVVRSAINNEYFVGMTNNAKDAMMQFALAYSDATFMGPASGLAKIHTSVGGSTFYYIYSHSSYRGIQINKPHELPGAGHGEDLAFAFGHPLLNINYLPYTDPAIVTEYPYSTEEKRLSEDFMSMLANFAKIGNPSYKDVKFPPFTAKDQSYLELTVNSSVKSNPAARRMALWTDLIPRLLELSQAAPSTTPQPTGPTTSPGDGASPDEQTGALQMKAANVEIILWVVIAVAGLLILIVVGLACRLKKKPKANPNPTHRERRSHQADKYRLSAM